MIPARRAGRSAFTLIELLIVITIIGVIASILLGVTSKVRENADRAKCINNLHQIGTAVLAYQGDHNGFYPGPVGAGQTIYYTNETLPAAIAAYIGLPSTPTKQIVPIMRCPTWQRVAAQPTKSSDPNICYVVDFQISLVNGANFEPLGYPGLAGNVPKSAAMVASLEGTPIRPNTSASATPTFSMTTTMFMTDCDQLDWAFSPGAGWYSVLPKTPVHGNIRNTLFYDMHAEARPASLVP